MLRSYPRSLDVLCAANSVTLGCWLMFGDKLANCHHRLGWSTKSMVVVSGDNSWLQKAMGFVKATRNYRVYLRATVEFQVYRKPPCIALYTVDILCLYKLGFRSPLYTPTMGDKAVFCAKRHALGPGKMTLYNLGFSVYTRLVSHKEMTQYMRQCAL